MLNSRGELHIIILLLFLLFTDFEKRGKKEVCPILDQFLCHVAKTGETM